MTANEDSHPNWNAIAKIAISCIGAILTIAIAFAGKAADRQAEAFEQLKDAVYDIKRDTAVTDTRLTSVENRVGILENRVYGERK